MVGLSAYSEVFVMAAMLEFAMAERLVDSRVPPQVVSRDLQWVVGWVGLKVASSDELMGYEWADWKVGRKAD